MKNDVTITVCRNDLPAHIRFPNGMVAIDTETLGLNVLRDRLCVCQLGDGEGNVWLVQFDGTDYSAPNLKKVLGDNRLLKLFHFARFDLAVLRHYLGVMVEDIFCTKIASKLTRTYTDRHGLKDVCLELLGVQLDKGQQSSNWAAPELSPAQQAYAASDVVHLHALKAALDTRLKEADRMELAHACFAFLPTRALLDLHGWEHTDIFAHS